MKIYFIRHGEATHLEEDWLKVRFSRKAFIKKMIEWEYVNLTKNGENQAKEIAKILPKSYKFIYTSPLPRTIQTTKILNIHHKPVFNIHGLKEIVTSPPRFLNIFSLPIWIWIYICIISSLFNGVIFKIINDTRDIYKCLLATESDIVIVSHSMRIRAFVYLAYFLPSLQVASKDFSPCGISVVCTKRVKEKIKETCKAIS